VVCVLDVFVCVDAYTLSASTISASPVRRLPLVAGNWKVRSVSLEPFKITLKLLHIR
jgi:hypothetical protein